MNKNSNTYTFLYAIILVVVVATALALAAMGLKDRQQQNIELEKKLNILAAVNKVDSLADADDKNALIEQLYEQYIVEQFIVDGEGTRKEGDAFTIDMKEQADIIKEINATDSDDEKTSLRKELNLPVFVCRNDDGALKYIVPLRGMGLWGAIWGYVSFNDDFNTIYGAVFDHKGETPGLGAEISVPKFSAQMIGKQIFKDGQFVSIQIVKGSAPAGDRHSIDAISGGTITSRGVEAMLKDCLNEYRAFFRLAVAAPKSRTNTTIANPQ